MPGRVSTAGLKDRSPRDREAIGDRLSRLRRERGISQTDLGRKISVTQRMVSCYETGRIRVPSEMLLKIADLLKVSVYELLGRSVPRRSPRDPKLWKVVEKLESLPPKDRKVVFHYIETVTRKAAGRA